MVRPAAVLYFWSGMDDPALRGLLRRLRTGQGTRVSCARAPWVRLAGTHRRLDESSMPLEPCARWHGDHAGTAVPAERASRALRRAALCGHCKEERAEPARLLQGYPATPSRFPHPYPYATPTPRWTLLSVPSHLPPAARNRARSLRRQSHHVAHPAPDEDPAARLAAASITLRVHARRRRCGSRRARQGDAAHGQAAAATGCPRRRDEAVRGRDVRRRGGHVAPVCRAAGRALVRSSAQREHTPAAATATLPLTPDPHAPAASPPTPRASAVPTTRALTRRWSPPPPTCSSASAP